jgi:hypothetical protein
MVRNCLKTLDSGFRRNDGKWYFLTFYETINLGMKLLLSVYQYYAKSLNYLRTSPVSSLFPLEHFV